MRTLLRTWSVSRVIDAGQARRRQFLERTILHRRAVVKTGKQDLQQVLAGLADRAFGGHVLRRAIVQSAGVLIGVEQFRNRLFNELPHPYRVASCLAL